MRALGSHQRFGAWLGHICRILLQAAEQASATGLNTAAQASRICLAGRLHLHHLLTRHLLRLGRTYYQDKGENESGSH